MNDQSDTQKKKFIATARELGVDESEAAFDAKLAKLGKHKLEKAEKGKPE